MTTVDLGVAEAAVRAAAPAGNLEVALAGRVKTWHTSAIVQLLKDAHRISWEEPPPGLDGFDLVCQVGDAKYRLDVTAPAPGGRR